MTPFKKTLSARVKLIVVLITAFGLSAGCGKDEEEGPHANDALNAWMRNQFPDGHEASGEPSFFNNDDGDGGERTVIQGGETLTAAVDSDGTPTAVCIGFGSASNAWCVPTTNDAVTTTDDGAVLNFPVPPEICDGLSEICHDIKCYEFAETDSGTFTAGDVAYLASQCGKCDEPSCQDLLPPGTCIDIDVGGGSCSDDGWFNGISFDESTCGLSDFGLSDALNSGCYSACLATSYGTSAGDMCGAMDDLLDECDASMSISSCPSCN
jgi:hypothetical protein